MSRHQGTFARPAKTLAIAKPSKTPRSFDAPVSRVAAPPPELSDTSTIYSRHSSRQSGGTYSDISDDYESSYPNIDVMDQITDRMDKLWDPEPMDRIRDRQTKTCVNSGSCRKQSLTNADLESRVRKPENLTRQKPDLLVDCKERESTSKIRWSKSLEQEKIWKSQE